MDAQRHADADQHEAQRLRHFLSAKPLLLGLLLGIATRMGGSAPSASPNPNVVILRSEKVVTLEKPKVTLAEMADEFTRQTGRKITLDPKYQEDKTPYAFLLKTASLPRTLNAVAYMLDGTLERRGTGWLIRPTKAEDKAKDVSRYEAALDIVASAFRRLDLDDPANAKDAKEIRQWLADLDSHPAQLYPFPLDTMGSWRVTPRDKGFSISYSISDTDPNATESGRFGSASWSWQ